MIFILPFDVMTRRDNFKTMSVMFATLAISLITSYRLSLSLIQSATVTMYENQA